MRHWPPRLMRDEDAAAYMGIGVSTFRAQVERGHLPKPVPLYEGVRVVVWDRFDLDRVIDRRKGNEEGYADPDEAVEKFDGNRKARPKRRHG